MPFLDGLVLEVITNGFIEDLLCGKPVDLFQKELSSLKKINPKRSGINCFPIMEVVKSKMEHPTHKEMCEPLKRVPHYMLALILYTGGDSNYDLGTSQRNGNQMIFRPAIMKNLPFFARRVASLALKSLCFWVFVPSGIILVPNW